MCHWIRDYGRNWIHREIAVHSYQQYHPQLIPIDYHSLCIMAGKWRSSEGRRGGGTGRLCIWRWSWAWLGRIGGVCWWSCCGWWRFLLGSRCEVPVSPRRRVGWCRLTSLVSIPGFTRTRFRKIGRFYRGAFFFSSAHMAQKRFWVQACRAPNQPQIWIAKDR